MSGTVVGLDIGTSFIKVAIGEINANTNEFEIISVAKYPSQGLRNGVIVNIDAVTECIKNAISMVEQESGIEVVSLFASIGGSQVESRNSVGQVGVDQSGQNRALEINENAKKRAIEASKAVAIPLDKKLIHVIPQQYIIDGQGGIKKPLGMMCVRLEVAVHLVTASVTAYSNINHSINRAGFNLNNIMLNTLASSYSCLHEDEMELGSILIDLGSGTTDVMVLNEGAPVFTCSIPYGGNHVTNDIATVKGIPFAEAEKIKINSGTCWLFGTEEQEEVLIAGIVTKAPELSNKKEIHDIISPRMEEILCMVRHEVVKKSGLKRLNGSIVLTGGGALMTGIVDLVKDVFNTDSVRIGIPSDMGNYNFEYKNPDYAVAVGLAFSNVDFYSREKKLSKVSKSGDSSKKNSFLKNFFKKIM